MGGGGGATDAQQRVEVPFDSREKKKKSGQPPPAKKTLLDLSLGGGPAPGGEEDLAPMVIEPFQGVTMVKHFKKGELDLVHGEVYVLKFVVYETWRDDKTGVLHKQLMASQIVRSPISAVDQDLPFDVGRIVMERDVNDGVSPYPFPEYDMAGMVWLPIEHCPELLDPEKTKFPNRMGAFNLPETWDSDWLLRDMKDGKQPSLMGPPVQGQAGRQSHHPMTFCQARSLNDVETYIVNVGVYPNDLKCFGLDTNEQWVALAPNLLKMTRAVAVGKIDRTKTAFIPPLAKSDSRFHGVVQLVNATLFDAATMVCRAGVRIDPSILNKLLDQPYDRLYNQAWLYAKNGIHVNCVNLRQFSGDATNAVEAVGRGEAKLFVVCNHTLDPQDIDEVRAFEPEKMVKWFACSRDVQPMMRPNGKMVHAVYLVAPNAMELLESAAAAQLASVQLM